MGRTSPPFPLPFMADEWQGQLSYVHTHWASSTGLPWQGPVPALLSTATSKGRVSSHALMAQVAKDKGAVGLFLIHDLNKQTNSSRSLAILYQSKKLQ